MSENQALEGAIVAARDAAQNTEVTQLIAALLAVQAQQQTAQVPAVAPKPSTWTPGKVTAVTGAVVAGGAVVTGMLLAVAITACSLAITALVLRWIIADMRKGR